MAEHLVQANGLTLWAEDFGSPNDPAVLLIMGAASQGIGWPDELCTALAQGGRYVIRYDHRDTGKSSLVDFTTAPYTISDMAEDAIGLLDALNVEAAHLVGVSMGGMIAQQFVLNAPERALSLTSWMSTPLSETLMVINSGTPHDHALPGCAPVVLAAAALQPSTPNPTREQIIEGNIGMIRALTGTLAPFDEPRQRRMETLALERATSITSAFNHGLAIAQSPDRSDSLGAVSIPTLVLHGTADPMFPIEHGIATADAIPGARFVPIEGLGHEVPLAVVPTIVPLLLEHTADAIASRQRSV